MHSMGLHSALAIKRQRKRRADLKKAKERRYSIQSTESGLGGSHSSFASPRNSLDGTENRGKRKQSKNTVGGFETNVGIGMLHIGVVFIVLGVFLLGSTLIPSDFENWEWQNLFSKKVWWNELVITGTFSLLLGIFLIILDRFITKREEDDLNKYVQGQLTRSRSGHRLVRDIETGNLVTKRSKTMTGINDEIRSRRGTEEDLAGVHSPKSNSSPGYTTGNHVFMNGETEMLSPQLERIMEEEISAPVESYRTVERNALHDEYDSTTASVSPGSPSETQELLVGNTGYTFNPPVPSKFHQQRYGPRYFSSCSKGKGTVVRQCHAFSILLKQTLYARLTTGAETTINMMGAMPAVAVRLERRKAEKRLKRPSQLYLSGYPHLRQQSASPSRVNSPSPSPLLSPPRLDEEHQHHQLPEIYVCGKVSALHLAVVSLLLGAVILIVGLVQLKPGADAPGHRYYLIAVGCILEVVGLIITAIRCVMLHMKIKKQRMSGGGSGRKVDRNYKPKASLSGDEAVRIANENGIEEEAKAQNLTVDQPPVNLKHLYNSSDVIYIDEVDSSSEKKSANLAGSVTTIDVLMVNPKTEPAAQFGGCSGAASTGDVSDLLGSSDGAANV